MDESYNMNHKMRSKKKRNFFFVSCHVKLVVMNQNLMTLAYTDVLRVCTAIFILYFFSKIYVFPFCMSFDLDYGSPYCEKLS